MRDGVSRIAPLSEDILSKKLRTLERVLLDLSESFVDSDEGLMKRFDELHGETVGKNEKTAHMLPKQNVKIACYNQILIVKTAYYNLILIVKIVHLYIIQSITTRDIRT